MATATAKFYVGGTKLLPYHIHIEQYSDWHHRFEITVSTEKANVLGGDMGASESVIIENAIAYAGEGAEISIERPNGTFNFKGTITDVHIDQTYAGDSFIIFRGYSPTYFLEGQPSVASFEEKTLKDIFEETLSGFSSDAPTEVSPAFTNAIPYIVRYKENQYEFLSRLAADYGEWFYYDGQKIVFGELPSESPKVELSFGSDSMLSFNYGINLRPTNFKQQFYKYEDNAPVESSVAGFKPGWLDPHSKISHDAANELFTEEGLDPVMHHVKDDQHIKHLAEAKKSSHLSDVMAFRGRSANPGITIGAEVEVSSRSGFIGKYRVIAVTHNFNSNRDYYNQFQAIPATSQVPPLRREIEMPRAEPQIGIVTDNKDPNSQGRVRVQLKWEGGATPWIRVLTTHAGEDRGEGIYGTYFIPEIGDEVMVEFEHGNPARPYVVGTHYHGSIAPEFYDADNNLKAIKTRSGHKLVFDDTDGDEKILITDKKGNSLKIETKGDNIYVKAGTSIIIEAGESVSVTAGKRITLKSADTISLASGAINIVAGATVNIAAGASYSLSTTSLTESAVSASRRAKNLNHLVSDSLNVTAGKINHTAKKSVSTKAKENITFSAKKKLDQRGGEMNLMTQKGKLKVKAKSNVEIKGKQVKTN